MTTVSLPLAIWGSGYSKFLPRWWEGVTSLQKQPDEIVIVADDKNFDLALSTIPTGYSATVLRLNADDYADYWNRAIEACSSTWVAICNVDDKFLPEALNDIDAAEEAGCNLITDSIQDLVGGQIYKSSWNGSEIAHDWTMVGAEPMKLDLFLKAGGFVRGQRFADWALAMKAFLIGVKAFDTNTVRILYDRGLNRKTVSSQLNPPEVLNAGYVSLKKLAIELGIRAE